MFDFFRNRTREDYIKEGKATFGLPEPKEHTKMPVVSETNKEYYRIGVTDDGKTTLTILGTGEFNMTLTMNKVGCEQLIRMIRATYVDDKEE